MIQRVGWSGVFVLVACATAPPVPSNGPTAVSTGSMTVENAAASRAAAFAALEGRLLEARTVRLAFHVTATGAVEAEIRGDLTMDDDGEIELAATGEFAGRPVDLMLRTEGDRYRFGSVGEPAEGERPGHLREALLIGLSRMGILHNLARLSGGAPPDRGAGGVTDWAEVENFGSVPADPDAIVFGLRVAGQAVGSAVLLTGPDGLPRLRRQTVRFPEGEMRVVERYADVAVRP